jgi:hypothetical protein
VLVVDDAGAGGFNEGVGGERDDLLARGHDLADGGFVELEGAVDEALLKRRQDAHAAGGGGDELELFGRVDGGFLGHGDLEEMQDDAGGVLQQMDRRDG